MRKTSTQRQIEKRLGAPIEDLLREWYIDQRFGDQEIAEALDVTRGAVQQWREQFGITRDDRPPLVAA
jgi:hypothetical protein